MTSIVIIRLARKKESSMVYKVVVALGTSDPNGGLAARPLNAENGMYVVAVRGSDSNTGYVGGAPDALKIVMEERNLLLRASTSFATTIRLRLGMATIPSGPDVEHGNTCRYTGINGLETSYTKITLARSLTTNRCLVPEKVAAMTVSSSIPFALRDYR